MKIITSSLALIAVAVILVHCAGGCRSANKQEGDQMKSKDSITTVMDRHAPELMKLPGVVGVYIGARADGREVIRVMVAESDPERHKKIPAVLEGYPVEIEVSGVIKPMH